VSVLVFLSWVGTGRLLHYSWFVDDSRDQKASPLHAVMTLFFFLLGSYVSHAPPVEPSARGFKTSYYPLVVGGAFPGGGKHQQCLQPMR